MSFKFRIVLVAVGAFMGGMALFLAFSKGPIARTITQLPQLLFGHFPASADTPLLGEMEGRINILLLGVGGKGHAGPDLADTTMVVSIAPQEKRLALLSLPRDMVVPLGNLGWRKINILNALGEARAAGQGPVFAQDMLSRTLGIPLHYYARVDFTGFEQFIDAIGGVDVQVPNTLIDEKYPILGKEDEPDMAARYETLRIEKGLQNFDGAMALRYVRSRYAAPPEHSDFARMRRQQLLLESIKTKLTSSGKLRLAYLMSLTNLFFNHVATNLTVPEAARIGEMVSTAAQPQISAVVLKAGPNELLHESTGPEGAYILLPNQDDFAEIKALARDIFFHGATLEGGRDPEITNVVVRNGTPVVGLALKTAALLKAQGFKVLEASNADTQDYDSTVIYVLNPNLKEKLQQLREYLGASVALLVPARIKDTVPAGTDFVIVVGKGKM